VAVSICDALGITSTELNQQPAEWVIKYKSFLEGKSLAQKELNKVKQPRPPVIPKYKIPLRKR